MRAIFFLLVCGVMWRPAIAADAPAYDRLLPGTVLAVAVEGHPDLARHITIEPTGMVVLPPLAGVKAEGLQPAELAATLRTKLEEANYIVPKVEVQIVSRAPIYVTGLVEKPGQYAYQPRLYALQAVAMAGGFAQFAEQENLRLWRPTKAGEAPQQMEAEPNTELLPGDTLEITRRWF